jgi:hypothetical protein
MQSSSGITPLIVVVLGLALFIALFVFASPLIAIVIALIAGGVGLLVMSMLRHDSRRSGERPVTPEGSPTSPTGSRSGGAPASGEGN